VGYSPQDALLASTLSGADLLGRAADFGSLEIGKRADLVALRGNPLTDIEAVDSLDFVMKGGVVYRDDCERCGKDRPGFW
jgi:imidazolonepropionase-like amidohydrolase